MAIERQICRSYRDEPFQDVASCIYFIESLPRPTIHYAHFTTITEMIDPSEKLCYYGWDGYSIDVGQNTGTDSVDLWAFTDPRCEHTAIRGQNRNRRVQQVIDYRSDLLDSLLTPS